MIEVDVALNIPADLGESPCWSPRSSTLLWVDIFRGELHSFDPAAGIDRHMDVGQPLGMAAQRASGGIVCAVRDGIGFADLDSGFFELAAPLERDTPANRMNDGACDQTGRLWAGTMATDLSPERGTLYRIESSPSQGRVTTPLQARGTVLTIAPAVNGLSISNGLGWSPDNRTMYLVDSPTQRVDAFSFDVTSGDLSDRRAFCRTPAGQSTPDGLAVDAAGGVWLALWDGGAVLHYDADGALVDAIEVPAVRVTSVAFGGPNLNQLFITTARTGLTAEQLKREPHSGSIFVAEPGVEGLPQFEFAG